MIESPVYEKGYPSYEAVNRKPAMKLRYSEAFYLYIYKIFKTYI